MSTLFTDNFTNSGGSDTNINSWQSVEQASGSADWADQAGSTANDLVANHTSQKLTLAAGATSGGIQKIIAKVINAVMTGVSDYKVSGSTVAQNGIESSFIGARLQASDQSGYLVGPFGASPVAKLYKVVAGTLTELDTFGTAGVELSAGTTYTSELTVNGSTLTWKVGAMTARVVTNSVYATGAPGAGISCWPGVFGAQVYMHIDNFLVESLSSAVTLTATANTITLSAPAQSQTVAVTLAAGSNTVTLSAPAATINGAVTLSAGANTITLSAPTASISAAVTLTPGANTITITAPALHIHTVFRVYPLLREEHVVFSHIGAHTIPAFDYQDPALIP